MGEIVEYLDAVSVWLEIGRWLGYVGLKRIKCRGRENKKGCVYNDLAQDTGME